MPGALRVEPLDVDAGDGLRLHLTRAGEGPPLVLLHGFTGSGETWAPLRAALGARRTTVTVDLPGHGASTAPDDPSRYALDRFADDLAHALDVLALERVALLGYSLGGRAALRFAVQHPGRLAALVLESSTAGFADAAARAERVAADTALAAFVEREGIVAFVDRWERLPLWASQAALPGAARATLRAQRLANRPHALARSLIGAGAGALPAVTAGQLAGIAVPTLVAAGALDAKYAAEAGRLEAATPGARLAVVPDAGHAVHLEQPARFAGIVAAFLDEVHPSAGTTR